MLEEHFNEFMKILFYFMVRQISKEGGEVGGVHALGGWLCKLLYNLVRVVNRPKTVAPSTVMNCATVVAQMAAHMMENILENNAELLGGRFTCTSNESEFVGIFMKLRNCE